MRAPRWLRRLILRARLLFARHIERRWMWFADGRIDYGCGSLPGGSCHSSCEVARLELALAVPEARVVRSRFFRD